MINRSGQQFGNYRIIRPIGHGGFAEVYLGEHIYLQTQVAIKILQTRLAEENMEGFLKEARTIAHLIHPHIVRVLDFGTEGGTPFLVMDYAHNGTLRQRYPKGTRLPLDAIVTYTKQAAEALWYAHEKKLIHRDIKPENMLLGESYQVLLSDFGIALMTQSTRYQNTQEVIGTVAYMAPEQLQGKPRRASDQYSLGIVVYEWMCGERPFHGSFTEIYSQHMFVPPPSLREKVPELSSAVEQVVLTALAKDPQQRFASVPAFATALEQACRSAQDTSFSQQSQALEPTIPVLSPSQPLQLVTPTPPLRETRQQDGNDMSTPSGKPLSSQHLISRRAVLLGSAGLIVAGSGITWLMLSHSSPGSALKATTTVAPTLTSAPSHAPTYSILPVGTTLYTYYGHSAKIKTLAWSPNDRRIASASDDYTAQVWDATTGNHAVIYHGHSLYVPGIAWSPDGKRVASSGADTTVQIWDPDTGDPLSTYHGHSLWVNRISWSPNGKYIASGEQSSTVGRTVQVRVWETSSLNTIVVYQGHTNGVFSVAWSPDGTRVASCGYDGTVQVWEGTTGNLISTYSDNVFHYGLAWSPDSTRVVVGSQDALVRVLDANTGKIVYTYSGHADYVGDVDWSPDGKLIASGSADQTVQVFDAANGTKIYTYQKQSGHIDALAWSRDSKRIVSGSNNSIVEVWQAVSIGV